MELLYLWIQQSENGFIENKGFNFSPLHRFDMMVENGCHRLSYNKIDSINVFSETDSPGVLSNVTAIVGKNGAGKTSLLNYIYRTLMPLPHTIRGDTAYEMNDLEYNESQKSVWCFMDNSSNINVYYHLDGKELIVKGSTYFALHKLDINNSSNYLLNDVAYNEITTIYLSNSIYQELNGYQLRTELSKCVLTPFSLRFLSNLFYKSVCRIEDTNYTDRFRYIQNIIIETKTEKDFQLLCDILFLYRLYKNNTVDNYKAKINIDLVVNFRSFMQVLLNKHPDFKRTSVVSFNDIPVKHLYKLYVFTNKSLSECSFVSWDNPNLKIIARLYVSLFMEICFVYSISDERELIRINNQDELITYLGRLISEIKSDNKTQFIYFSNALKEINQLEVLLRYAPTINDSLPSDDLAKKNGIIFSFKNKMIYTAFLKLIDQSFKSKNSFILKYIQIDNLAMSSGERAFQNYFSWINLLPEFNKINNGNEKNFSLKKNVLLLIDEIDLYLHPDWQRTIIDYLTDELCSQFEGYKIQVVFTTHSPIVLSDIPKMNTIYLTVNDGKLDVDNIEKHQESFAVNIYNILDDSFYLSNAMGRFSEKLINKIIRFLNDDTKTIDSSNEVNAGIIEKYMKITDIVGEPVIRKMLKDMLLAKMLPNEKLEVLLREKEQIEQMIKNVEKGNQR